MPSKAPTGTVTFLFTDIVGSTEMWEQHGDGFLPVLQAHNAILADAIARYGGYLVKTEGDAFKVAFSDPAAAVHCAILAQAALQRYPWPSETGPIRVRMAVHTGQPFMQEGDYFGPPVNRTARILSTTHGGQILISEATYDLVVNGLERGTQCLDQGPQRLRDLDEPIRLFQVEHPHFEQREFPPPRSLNGYANNLPVQRPSFVGREKEIEQIAALLSSPDTPLLTLTGPAGSGKTRLSLQVAAERIEWFPDGVWLVRLTHACDSVGAAIEVADAIGIPLQPGRSPLDTVRDWLADRRCLLILDDCGSVPQAGSLIRELLSGASTLRCLATSRESLEIAEAAEFSVPELSAPPESASATQLMESEAGRLFVERAHEARPDFELSDARAKPIARLLNKVPNWPGTVEKLGGLLKNRDINPIRMVEAVTKQIAPIAEEAGHVAIEQGRELMHRIQEAPGVSELLHTVAASAADRQALDAQEKRVRDSLSVCRTTGDRVKMAGLLRELGHIYMKKRDYGAAITAFAAAYDAHTGINSAECRAVAAELETARRMQAAEEARIAANLERAIDSRAAGE